MRPSASPPHHLAAATAALLAVALLGACATSTVPVAPSQSAMAPPLAERASATPRTAAPPRAVALHWAFAGGTDLCTAAASGQGGALQIQTTARTILVAVRFDAAAHPEPPRLRPATLRFRSAAGDWSVPGTWQRRVFSSQQPLDAHGVASVLSLLGGGSATVSAGRAQLGAAQVPSAGVEGNDWALCPKQMMAPS